MMRYTGTLGELQQTMADTRSSLEHIHKIGHQLRGFAGMGSFASDVSDLFDSPDVVGQTDAQTAAQNEAMDASDTQVTNAVGGAVAGGLADTATDVVNTATSIFTNAAFIALAVGLVVFWPEIRVGLNSLEGKNK